MRYKPNFLRSCLSFCALMLCLSILFVSCAQKRPEAVLHDAGSVGYIPCISNNEYVEISSEQAFVYDLNAGGFTYLKGADRVLYPASTTKLLTILYALTLLEPDELVTPGDEISLVPDGSSMAYVNSSHTLTVEMLIEGMLIPSGNDAAYALAAAAGKKLYSGEGEISGEQAVGLFMDGMNEYAKEIGLCGSRFLTPDGYSDEGHYSTVEDIAIIASLAYENDIIRKYAAMPEDDVVYASGHKNHWKNTNHMLDKESKYYSPYVTGLKTGSLGRGNYSLICSVEIFERTYIVGVFSSKSTDTRFDDMLTLIDRIYAVAA